VSSPLKHHAARAVPRYTSYPTANHFHEGIRADQVGKWLANLPVDKPISLYVHIPFCDRLCWFCGCHTKQTNRYQPVRDYIEVVTQEIALVAAHLPAHLEVCELHLGGGSPSLLRTAEFIRLRHQLEKYFVLTEGAQISVEIDPQDLTADTLAGLQRFGLTRASLGVQDFDARVQAAINRPQSFEDTRAACEQMRALGVRSLNIDALYGLPYQSVETIERTIDQVISLDPDRIALFGYAHVPWLKKHQTRIAENTLPTPDERVAQAERAEEILLEAGYCKIGLDHFAKPQDTLARADRAGALHRNFQGYTSDQSPFLIGFGASAISYLGAGYTENIVATGRYAASVSEGCLPIGRGIALRDEDTIRRHVIERLMCDFKIDFDRLEAKFGPLAAACRRDGKVAALELADICVMEQNALVMKADTHHLVRLVASRFDTYFQESAARHSLAV